MKSLFLFVFLFTNLSLAQWYPQNSGTTENLYSINFVDENTGWASGSNGTIIKTTNGGLNWFFQNSGTNSYLNEIEFVDQNNGWTCGGNLILSTVDGGSNWSPYSFPPDYSVTSIQFVNSNIGWATVNYYDNSTFNGYVYKTTNGGSNWTSVYQVQSEDFLGVFFIDENNGWVVGVQSIFKTTDGGNSWSIINANLTGAPLTIDFVNASTGWISHNTLGSYALIKTTDGGLTWFNQSVGSFLLLNSIDFINTNIGYAIGYTIFAPPTPEQFSIYRTIDGGESWSNQFEGNGELNSVFFVNESIGWTVGNNGKIYFTINGDTPVELISFTATLENDMVNLNWQTASETNNRGFEVERRIVNDTWEKINFIESKGTTTEITDYSFTDDVSNISAEKIYYRLKQNDYDGTFEYSEEVEMKLNPIDFALRQNFPNPFNPTTIIKYEIPEAADVTLIVHNILGREVATLVDEYKERGRYEVEFRRGLIHQTLASGVYFYRLKANDYIDTKKMLILK